LEKKNLCERQYSFSYRWAGLARRKAARLWLEKGEGSGRRKGAKGFKVAIVLGRVISAIGTVGEGKGIGVLLRSRLGPLKDVGTSQIRVNGSP